MKFFKKTSPITIHYDTLKRELTETIACSLSPKDIEAIGQDLLTMYNTRKAIGANLEITISSHNAARILVDELYKNNRISDLISYLVQMEGNYLNGKIVHIAHLENLLYHLSENGYLYDDKENQVIHSDEDSSLLKNWGALKDGKNYDLIVGSLDICNNSHYVKKYGMTKMERIYVHLNQFLLNTIVSYSGRIWSWAGDGGIIAFRNTSQTNQFENAVRCMIEIQLRLPILNLDTNINLYKPIELRIALDYGRMRFYNNVGQIVSDAINYAAHLEKKGTQPSGISISEIIHKNLKFRQLRDLFSSKSVFEDRVAYSLVFDHKAGFGFEGNDPGKEM